MFIVLCLDDDGRYVQATRKRFERHSEALDYAATLAKDRKPITVVLDD